MTGKISGYPVYPKRADKSTGPVVPKPGSNSGAFQAVLTEKLRSLPVKFSAHAERRLNMRGITLGEEELAKLTNAVDKAAGKGARESLVLLGNVALVVSIANRTVITAVDGEHMKENVFTNIDSAVIT